MPLKLNAHRQATSATMAQEAHNPHCCGTHTLPCVLAYVRTSRGGGREGGGCNALRTQSSVLRRNTQARMYAATPVSHWCDQLVMTSGKIPATHQAGADANEAQYPKAGSLNPNPPWHGYPSEAHHPHCCVSTHTTKLHSLHAQISTRVGGMAALVKAQSCMLHHNTGMYTSWA